ncbi:class I SAM-dependent methyltransferase [Pontimonas sp.]|jgi:hypothetical protein|uniref:class I SAM-dependent methyltransferase n=1 Tax=Pontimonas sp. TaxID=2304492 RepID=UPI00286FCD5E|nr:class I SAM-dependent methyltransferase [Pontimonas sp.]MDR9397008.1 class I SAM-dependent methyltransferase [Pontimonas sp.]MDR9434489.1 class I SAM-dependent methyltransferase [Pontimonas sp.]
MAITHLLLRGWAALVHGTRKTLQSVGALAWLDRWALSSRIGLWVRSLFSLYDVEDFVRLDLPWWTLDSISLVDDFLVQRPEARVFEWGSGASTIWLEKRAGAVISVEYDPEWHAMMQSLVGPHTTLVHTPAEASKQPSVGSKMWGHKDLDYRDYVAALDQVDGAFDLIVIDGRARSACLEKAVTRLAPGGMVVFDNTNRRRYQSALETVKEGFEGTTTHGLTPSLPWSTQTTLLRKHPS